MHSTICCGFLFALCGSSIAFAQQAAPEPAPCNDDETVIQCLNRIQDEAAPAAAMPAQTAAEQVTEVEAQQKESVKQELASAQTGAGSAGAATATTVNDLAQWLNALGLLSSGEQGSKLSLDLNFLLPVQDVENNNAQLKAVVNTEAEPLEQLVSSFAESVRTARKDSLQKDISTFGDTQISFTWALVNSRFGRDYSVLRRSIAPLNAGAVARGRGEVDAIPGLPNLVSQINTARTSAGDAPINMATRFRDLPISRDLKDQLKEAAYKAGAQRAAVTQGIQAELARTGINRLAELVEEQPQLLFTLTHDIRDDIVGPEKTAATVTWEMTRRNFSAFMRGDGRACEDPEVAKGTEKYSACASALQRYLGDEATDVTQQWRYKLEASYKRVKAVTYSYPDDSVNLILPEQDRWEIAFAAGRPMSSEKNGGRVDFELAYDSNLDDDTTNKERLTASLTYTRRVGEMDMPFSIVYANKDEFLGEVDHQISLNLGLRFRQPKK